MQYLTDARNELSLRAGEILAASAVYETEPWGTEGQASYLNQALAIQTSLPPDDLLKTVLEIERQLGRIREGRWGDRTIDIDIIYYGSTVIQTDALEIPHPRLHLRNFVLQPLVEIAPDFVHPVLKMSNLQLLNSVADALGVFPYPASE